MSGHALLAPSKAHRWIPCPGSIPFCVDYPDTDTEASIEGTAAHTLAAGLLTGQPAPATAEMFSYVRVYTDAIQRISEGKTLLVEQRVKVEAYTGEKDGFGTSDAIIIDDAGNLEIHDLKYGMIIVHTEENEQLMIYALGAIDQLAAFGVTVKTVKLAIHQPRRDHYSEWMVSIERLREFGAYAASRGTTALTCKYGEELYPTPKACEFCPAKKDCPAFEAYVHKQIYDRFEQLPDGTPVAVAKPIHEYVSPAELEMVEQWLEMKRKHIFDLLSQGVDYPGWKLVEGRAGNRRFTDETAIVTALKKMRFKAGDFTEKKLKPLTQIEKLVGKDRWKHFVPFITQAPGQPALAPSSDKRPAFNTTILEGFTNELEEFK